MLLLWILISSSLSVESQIAYNALEARTNLTIALIKKCTSDPNVTKFELLFNPFASTCPFELDGYLHCWPTTLVNQTVEHECNNAQFYPGTIRRKCIANRKWENVSMTKFCEQLPRDVTEAILDSMLIQYNITTRKELDVHERRQKILNLILEIAGVLRYIDLFICVSSFIVLLILIPLKNPRIMLHRNLIIAFIGFDIVQLVYYEVVYLSEEEKHKECSAVHILSTYFIFAQVCWMFNEGFFQFRQFFFVFIQKKYIWAYCLFGWLFPLIITLGVHVPLLWFYTTKDFEKCWATSTSIHYVVRVPIYVLLVLNLFIVIYLMWIIWSKLKTSEQQQLNRSRKALRGFAILTVLLGGGYLFSTYGPLHCEEYRFARVVLFTCQGSYVCIAHVLLSREVFEAVKVIYRRRVETFQLTRSTVRSDSAGYDYGKRFSIFDRRISVDRRRTSIQLGLPNRRLSMGSNKVTPVEINGTGSVKHETLMEKINTTFDANNTATVKIDMPNGKDLPLIKELPDGNHVLQDEPDEAVGVTDYSGEIGVKNKSYKAEEDLNTTVLQKNILYENVDTMTDHHREMGVGNKSYNAEEDLNTRVLKTNALHENVDTK